MESTRLLSKPSELFTRSDLLVSVKQTSRDKKMDRNLPRLNAMRESSAALGARKVSSLARQLRTPTFQNHLRFGELQTVRFEHPWSSDQRQSTAAVWGILLMAQAKLAPDTPYVRCSCGADPGCPAVRKRQGI